MGKKERGRKWDGKSRVSTDLYRKRYDEIFKKMTRHRQLMRLYHLMKTKSI